MDPLGGLGIYLRGTMCHKHCTGMPHYSDVQSNFILGL